MYRCTKCEQVDADKLCESCDAIACLDAGDRSDHQIAVDAFMKGAGQELPKVPGVPELKTVLLRGLLLLEEAWEYCDAAGIEIQCPDRSDLLGFGDLRITIRPGKQNFVEMVDALSDTDVVTTGAFSAFGVPNERVQALVDSNNLLKIKHGHKDPTTGKWIKPADHPKPDFGKLLKELGWKPTDD